jgi:DNA ligase-associated metallophosphoesterase
MAICAFTEKAKKQQRQINKRIIAEIFSNVLPKGHKSKSKALSSPDALPLGLIFRRGEAMTVELSGHKVELLYEKALYKPDEKLLLVADVHLGKASHFRKEGISIPAQAQQEDYTRLEQLIKKIAPAKVYFLGDLFHSTFNNDWNNFCALVEKFPAVKFTLVKGNHDLISKKHFMDLCVEVVDIIEDGHFVYSHELLDEVPGNKVNIAGHIHPGITLSGMGRQSLKLPCFYVSGNQVVLPAFGVLTGLYSMEKTASSEIYIVLPDAVKRI